MAATVAARDHVDWRLGKRPRTDSTGAQRAVAPAPPVLGIRRGFEEHKKALLAREQEREQRYVREALRRLEEIELQRRRVRARKIDRDKRRLAFVDVVERSTRLLQRVERGRQSRKIARSRADAALKLIRWAHARMQRAVMVKAIRNRTILRIMVNVQAMVDEQVDEACFVIRNLFHLRTLKHNRAARVIQTMVRERMRLVYRSASRIAALIRGWLARAHLRRARIRKSMLRHRGSLSRRALGIPEVNPSDAPLSAVREAELRKGRWWDVGVPVVPRPWLADSRVVEKGERRSRRRAASLADLIQDGIGVRGAAGEPSASNVMRAAGAGLREIRRDGARAVSMIDPREAEQAALLDEEARRRSREDADVAADAAARDTVRDKKRILWEKHLAREREFHAEQEKRREAAVKDLERKREIRKLEAAQAARKRELQAEMLQKKEEEEDQKRLDKIREYQRKKVQKDAAMRKALMRKQEGERRAKEFAEAKRQEADSLFEKQKKERLERLRRKLRTDEEVNKTRAAERTSRKRKEPRGLTPIVPPYPIREHSTKRSSAGMVRTVLPPIPVDSSNKRGRHRRRKGRLRRENNSITDSTHRKAFVVVRGGRQGERSHGSAVGGRLRLPIAACVKEGSVAGSSDRDSGKRTKQKGQTRRSSVGYTLAPYALKKENGGDGRMVLPQVGKTGRRRKADRSKAGIGQHGIGVGTESDTGTGVVSSSPRKLKSNRLRSGPIVEKPVRKDSEKHDRRNKESVRAKAAAPKKQRNPGSRDDYEGSVSAEVLTMAIWDAAFPAPKRGAGSAGNEGLGPTTGDEIFPPDWKSRSSRDSSDDNSRSLAIRRCRPRGRMGMLTRVQERGGAGILIRRLSLRHPVTV